MFEAKYLNSGVVEIDNGQVRVYDVQGYFQYLPGCYNAVAAQWAGGCIITRHTNSRTCRWHDMLGHFDYVGY